MIGYITLGSNNIQASTEFYDQIFNELGASRIWDTPSFIAWGADKNSPFFAVTSPFNKEPATAGNGVMIAIKAPNPESVGLAHATALKLGAINEGEPGVRPAGFYCAYCRDLDGNKLNFYCAPQE
ncbi:VOC family protein [Endozoicomonas arenosclerae]|uniref:VOC family protein n=1 Tax=Endozoicomonas arenosclerae TaxID=1633495 RepID=UPI000780DD45|nr:VOC family protein [Endozoicomonas arenosclerae]